MMTRSEFTRIVQDLVRDYRIVAREIEIEVTHRIFGFSSSWTWGVTIYRPRPQGLITVEEYTPEDALESFRSKLNEEYPLVARPSDQEQMHAASN